MQQSFRLARIGSLVLLAACSQASGSVIGQIDDFEDGTTQNWMVGLLGAIHPAPPQNVPDGGPLGAGDNYLLLTAIGGTGAGNRLVVINPVQWAGNYTDAGITLIGMDLINLGATDLNIRLYLENPMGAPPTDDAVSGSLLLPAGRGWTHVDFAIDALSLTAINGDVNTLLSNVTALRIIHNPDVGFPGPPVVASLGVDNITAGAPEPSTVVLAVAGLAILLLRSWRNQRRLS